MKKYKNKSRAKKRHIVVQTIAKPFMHLFLKLRMNFKKTYYDLPEGGGLILCNHTSTYDPFILGLSFKIPGYYVCSDDVLSKKFVGKLLNYIVAPIPKTKSVSDPRCVRTIIQMINEGHKVVLFPEGNRTYSGDLCVIDKSIAKLSKILNCPLIIFNIVGGYASDPRYAVKPRRSLVNVRLRKIISKEEIKELDNDTLYKEIINNLTIEGPHALAPVKNKKRAEYLERCLYYCPECSSLETIYSHKDIVECVSCGYKVRYNEDLTFSLLNGKTNIKDVSEWYKKEVDYISKYDPFKSDDVIYSDYPIRLFNVIKYKRRKTLIKKGYLKMTNKELIITSKNKNIIIPLDTITNACALGKNKGNFFVDDYIYQIKGKVRFSSLKYVNMYHHIKNIKNDKNIEGQFLGI